ncbi:MAG: TetR/AcrR family transcriptional regulator [Lactobacillus sp.]|nr:TetR/AcrR family transcriptional regulator [Lactobacillus sp.]
MTTQKEDLDQAAYKIFSEKGYKHTNIAEIAKSANMAVGSFYKFYKSKEALFVVLYVQENDRVKQQLKEQVDWEAKPAKVIDQLVTTALTIGADNPILAEGHNPDLAEALAAHYEAQTGDGQETLVQFLNKALATQLHQAQLGKKKRKAFLGVYDLLANMPAPTDPQDLPAYDETRKNLIKYFVKGILA